MLDVSSAVDTVYSPFEVACLDLVGREVGRPVSDLLGGAVRDRVPFSGYLFYKWAGHPELPDDEWGEALDPDGIVAQARRMVDGWGFGSLKLKGGVFAARRRSARPSRRCARRSPTCRCAWTPTARGRRRPPSPSPSDWPAWWSTSRTRRPASRAWRHVAARTDVPLATNMCVIAFEHVAPAVAADAVQIVLSDHHLWGGLRRSALLGGITETFGMGLSMHSNSHLGHLARRDGAPGRRDSEPDLRLRHPLPVEDPGRDRPRRPVVRRRVGGRADRARARRRARPRPARRAARAVPRLRRPPSARTPSTCGRSTRPSQPNTARW